MWLAPQTWVGFHVGIELCRTGWTFQFHHLKLLILGKLQFTNLNSAGPQPNHHFDKSSACPRNLGILFVHLCSIMYFQCQHKMRQFWSRVEYRYIQATTLTIVTRASTIFYAHSLPSRSFPPVLFPSDRTGKMWSNVASIAWANSSFSWILSTELKNWAANPGWLAPWNHPEIRTKRYKKGRVFPEALAILCNRSALDALVFFRSQNAWLVQKHCNFQHLLGPFWFISNFRSGSVWR